MQKAPDVPDDSNTLLADDVDCQTADDINDLLVLREWYRDSISDRPLRRWNQDPERGMNLTRDAARKLIPILQAFVEKVPT